MSKTTEFEIICQSAQTYPNEYNNVRVVVELTSGNMSVLINSISKEDLRKHLMDEVFEEWAEENGYVKEAEVK